MLLEDAPGSRAPVRDVSPNFPIFPEFQQASYAERYRLLGGKLVRENLYTSAAVILSPRNAGRTGAFSELDNTTGVKTFVTTFAAHIAAAAAR